MPIYYSQLNKLMSPDDASMVISKTAKRDSSQGALDQMSFAEKLGKDSRDRNFLALPVRRGGMTPKGFLSITLLRMNQNQTNFV